VGVGAWHRSIAGEEDLLLLVLEDEAGKGGEP
jgi:hypothetical protein